ncbi:MAG: hypothetical protein EBU46_16985, partial [Nitrosomonadaceae bacterium]|nr:hypothetical protein [Nitrosomonadaceae bacterium]
MSITGSNNVLLGSGAQLPSAAGSHQIVLGAAADTVYLGGAGTSSAGGVIIGAAGVTLSGVATFTVSGQTGALGQALTSGGAAAAPYWGPPLPQALASADTPLALAAPLAGLYSVTGGTAWALSLPLPAQATGTGTWLKSMASAAGTVGGPVVTLGATAPTTVVTMAPGDGGYFESDGAAWWVLSANQAFPGSNVAPTVNSVQPNVGSPAGGTNITINGSNFVGNTSVTIGGVAVTGLNFISSTQITATTPAGSLGSASVVVTTPYGANPANTLFTFANVPTISSISPAVGPLGGSNTVTLTGSYFVAGATTVTIGGTQIAAASVTVTGTTSLTFVAPAGQNVGEVDVTVTTIGTSAPILYGYAQQFLATGANQTFAVPSGVAQIKTIVAGAVGGSGRDVGGGGCTITSTINVTPGQQL